MRTQACEGNARSPGSQNTPTPHVPKTNQLRLHSWTQLGCTAAKDLILRWTDRSKGPRQDEPDFNHRRVCRKFGFFFFFFLPPACSKHKPLRGESPSDARVGAGVSPSSAGGAEAGAGPEPKEAGPRVIHQPLAFRVLRPAGDAQRTPRLPRWPGRPRQPSIPRLPERGPWSPAAARTAAPPQPPWLVRLPAAPATDFLESTGLSLPAWRPLRPPGSCRHAGIACRLLAAARFSTPASRLRLPPRELPDPPAVTPPIHRAVGTACSSPPPTCVRTPGHGASWEL
jgi:hypothetical protein